MIGDVLKKLMRKEGDLSAEEASRAMAMIMTGEAGEARTAALLTALALKGETGAEIEAFARSMRHAALRWPDEAAARAGGHLRHRRRQPGNAEYFDALGGAAGRHGHPGGETRQSRGFEYDRLSGSAGGAGHAPE